MNKINRFSKLTYKQILIFSGIVTIILFLLLGYFDFPLKTDVAPNGIISFELAKNIDTSIAIISSWDLNAKVNAGLSLGIDFLFLFVYGIFFALACFSVAKKFKDCINWFYMLGVYLAYLQFVAAFKFFFILLGIIYIVVGLIISISTKNKNSLRIILRP